MKWYDTSYANDAPIQQDQFWIEQLLKYQPDLKERIERTVNQWNTTLRDLIRNETGLRLNIGIGGGTTAQIKVVDGISIPLSQVLSHYQTYANLLLHEPLLKTTVQGLGFVAEHYLELHEFVPELCSAYELSEYANYEIDILQLKRKWLEEILQKLQAQGFKKALTQIEEDTLGAYFFKKNRIEIYWVAIGIYAAQLGVSVEGLTLVTLAHELAHAYTHLGKDIDGIEWHTEDFANTDLYIAEGLAQFYTRAICRKLDQRMPSALQAFETLLKHQSHIYQDFQTWAERSRHQGEVVRFSMIQCRTMGTTEYGTFLETLQSPRV